MADLTPEEQQAYRQYRAELRAARRDEVNTYHRRRYHERRSAIDR
jgi:hypothetical protein